MRRARAVLAAGVGLAALAAPFAPALADSTTARGETLFRVHCAQCHGMNADGNGALAARFDPRPSNLAASRRTDEYRQQIITLGGEAMGRSAVMPEWGLELSGQMILAIVEYLREVSDRHAAASPAAPGAGLQAARAGR